MISILIPTRNEAANIGRALARTAEVMNRAKLDYEILVIDDASNDGTVEIAEKIAKKNKNVRIVRRTPPYGFGLSLRDGIRMAKGSECVVLMADLSDDPALMPAMKKEIDLGADMVVGSRFIGDAAVRGYPFRKMISNRLFNLAIQAGLLSGIADSSNAFKMFKTEIARQIELESKGFEISAELTAKFIIRKARITEIPAGWSERDGGEAKFRLGNEAKRYFALYLKLLKEAYLPHPHGKRK